MHEHGLYTGGHVLVWPGERYLPRDVVAMADDPEALRERVRDHVRRTAEAFAGRLDEWDVLNEPIRNTFLMDVLGRDEMVQWFKIAHKADPNARLFINDHNILANLDQPHTAHRDALYEIIAFLLEHDAPVHAIGLQGHFSPPFTRPTYLLQILDRFAEFGLRITISELDIRVDDPQLQADYMRDFCIIAYSHPAVDSITNWGFWEGRHWIPEAALWDRSWSIKPNGKVWQDLTKNRWRTDTQLRTDQSGQVSTPVYFGSYRIHVRHQNKLTVVETEVNASGRDLEIILP